MSPFRTALATLMGFAIFAIVAVYAFYEASRLGGGWGALGPIWPYVAGGLIVVGGLTGVLMWLAFYSSRRGYDEPYDVNQPPPHRRR